MSEEAAKIETPAEPGPIDWMPLHDKMIVRRAKPKEFADEDERIAIAETHQKAQNKGTVIAVGGGRLLAGALAPVPLVVTVGMEVLFGQHSGIDLDEHPDLVILREDELLAWRVPGD